jgi:hypothetical protein
LARIRTLKPEFNQSPQVMNLSHAARLLFIGLITQADDYGRGSADARKLRAAIFPGDEWITNGDIDGLMLEVERQALVILYGPSSAPLYALPSWSGHQYVQRPKASNYPAPPDQSRNVHGTLTEAAVTSIGGSDRIGSEGIGKDRIVSTRARAVPDDHQQFENLKAAYPAFGGRQDWILAERSAQTLIEHGATWAELQAGVERYAAYVTAGGVSAPQYVMTPAKFFGAPDKPWAQPWDAPAAPTRRGRMTADEYDELSRKRLAELPGEDPGPL